MSTRVKRLAPDTATVMDRLQRIVTSSRELLELVRRGGTSKTTVTVRAAA